jgi:hypothetical protein
MLATGPVKYGRVAPVVWVVSCRFAGNHEIMRTKALEAMYIIAKGARSHQPSEELCGFQTWSFSNLNADSHGAQRSAIPRRT